MRSNFGGRIAAGMMALVLTVGACGYDNSSNPSGRGYDDTASSALGGLQAEPQVITATGDLSRALAAFRASLGDSANRTAGEQKGGRREINWDGVSGAVLNVDTFPGDFFNRVVPRGQIFSVEGGGLRVSDNNLADLNLEYANQFAAFSPTKIFIPVGRRSMMVDFVVAGSNTPARVTGFGVVFSDVDVLGSTVLEFFDGRGRLIRRVRAPARSDAAGFSFAGATFSSPVVARVRIISGQAAITGKNQDVSAGGDADLVATDDFISGEPHAIN